MDITSLIDDLRRDLVRAAEIGGEAGRLTAERLLVALEPALRLTLMEALSEAAAEISAALLGAAVEVRLQGREPVFVVRGPITGPGADEPFDPEEGDASARITLRLPQPLKERAEALAARAGQSLNTWLVGAVRAAAAPAAGAGAMRFGPKGRRLDGWAR